jgi:hypothetical protein
MESSIRVGTAVADITPEGVCELSGFAARTQPALGVHDPVCVRALSMESEGKKAALVVCDLLGFEPEADARIRERLRRELDLEGAILSCTHTHGGPASMRLIECGTQDDAWMAVLEETILSATREASGRRTPALLKAVNAEVRIGMNRRVHLNGKNLHLTTEKDRPEGIAPGLYDPALTILQFVGESGDARATVFNHACHPVSLGHEFRYVSADFPGVAERSLERARDSGGYGTSLFVQGSCGDVNPVVARRGWADCERLGMELAEAVRSGIQGGAAEIASAPLRYAEKRLTLPYRNDVGAIDVTLSALSVGDAAFVTLPGEAFCRQGIDIREASPFPYTIIAAYSNGNLGYIPTREAYPQGGYEVNDAHRYYGYPECVAPEAGETCVETALELLRNCKSA